MNQPWNDKSVLPPPVNTWICNHEIDLKTVKHALSNIIHVLSKQSPLHSESAILSRLLYKFDKKFRCDIGYRYFKKVNCVLRRYLTLNLLKDVEQFTSVLPDEENTPYYLPSKQMLEYVLIRIIAFSKLMLRAVVCSKQAAVFYLDRIRRGESHWMSLMPYAILSRIWSMTYVLLKYSCTWYHQLCPFMNNLQSKGQKFLPINFSLPINLPHWLGIKDINNFGHFEWSTKEPINIDLLQLKDVDDFENILHYVNQINEAPGEKEDSKEILLNRKLEDNNFNNAAVKKIDYGEAVSRSNFEKLQQYPPKSRRSNKDYFHVINNVINKNSLNKFIANEETFRNEGNSRALTNHLTFMQWQSLKNVMHQLGNKTINNRTLQRKFQKIWQQKCIDA